ncbi:hypothetical protein B0H16DRAFT_1730101 [Mycena metata]|uniref:Uncharacterized protein n=1 Tax=Mycena metata TaxID=1033252 RepID=A0AAD7I9R7_9AGAR|nr:hypothetical protein B0H16DRAFT_1730101 [Mycena metata]
MLSSWLLPYRPIAQEQHEKLLSESDSASDLLEVRNEGQTTRESWLGKTVLCLAVVNLLVAIAAVITLHDISKLRIPMAAVDISALPRPDPSTSPRPSVQSISLHRFLSGSACHKYLSVPLD